MVSKANDDLPEPDRPVITTSLCRGMLTSIFLRLWTRAPRTAIQLWAMTELRLPDSGVQTFKRALLREYASLQGISPTPQKIYRSTRRPEPVGILPTIVFWDLVVDGMEIARVVSARRYRR